MHSKWGGWRICQLSRTCVHPFSEFRSPITERNTLSGSALPSPGCALFSWKSRVDLLLRYCLSLNRFLGTRYRLHLNIELCGVLGECTYGANIPLMQHTSHQHATLGAQASQRRAHARSTQGYSCFNTRVSNTGERKPHSQRLRPSRGTNNQVHPGCKEATNEHLSTTM